MKGSTFLYPAIFKTALLPPLLIYLFNRLITSHHIPHPLRLPFWVLSVLYLLSWPTLFIIRSQISLSRAQIRARSLGASPIPRVHGRWPLNLDVLVDWSRSGSEEEVGRMMILLSRKYGGTYNTRVLGEDQIITTDPRVVKHVLVDDFDNFPKGPKFRERAEGFLGDGIFNADGDRWKFHRSLTRPFFHPNHINPSLFTPHIQTFLSCLPAPGSGVDKGQVRGETVDIQRLIGDLALDVALDWICGESVSVSVSNHVPGRARSRGTEWEASRMVIGDAMREAQKVVGRRVKIGTPWPLFELNHDPLLKPMKTIRTFFRPLIIEAQARKGSLGEEDKVRLIDRLVEAIPGDDNLIEDQLINILLASKDTSAALLTFCIYLLALHPAEYDKVREEVLAQSAEGLITKEHIGRCSYTRQFMNETLRLFPPVPLNIRRTVRHSLLPTSFSFASSSAHPTSPLTLPLYMPANTSIIVNTVGMQRDPAVWGEDALEFRPSRWQGQGGAEGFAAWNLGPRMCLGQPFALSLTHTFTILLVRHLEGQAGGSRIRLAPDAQPHGTRMPDEWKGDTSDGRAREGRDRVWIVADVVLAVKGGLWVRIE